MSKDEATPDSPNFTPKALTEFADRGYVRKNKPRLAKTKPLDLTPRLLNLAERCRSAISEWEAEDCDAEDAEVQIGDSWVYAGDVLIALDLLAPELDVRRVRVTQ